jgi:DNA-binding transcriptional LysR family regulator
VRLQVRAGSRQTDLTTEGDDLIIRVGASPPDGHFGRLLGHASLVLCATPPYPAQLAGARLLEYGPRRSSEWGFSCGGEVVTVDVDVVLSADSASLLIDACLAGLGVLRVPALAVREHIERGGSSRC